MSLFFDWLHKWKIKCNRVKPQIKILKGLYTFFNKEGPNTSGFPTSTLVMGEALSSDWGGNLMQEMGEQLATSVGKQSTSAHVKIPASTIPLHTAMPLSLTFTEEKSETTS